MQSKDIRIKEIQLKNYRQFIDQELKLEYIKDKNITIIEGKNGFGKSNIFNAINWCFFNTEEHLKSEAEHLPICNTRTFKDLKLEAGTKTSVRILLETESGEKEFERTAFTYKISDTKWNTLDSELKVMEVFGKNWKVAINPEYIVSKILPKDMRRFFFIDGEKLRQLFEDIKPDVIKDSISDLSQITLLQRAIDHLIYVKNGLRKAVSSSKNSGESTLYTLQAAFDELQNEIKSGKERLFALKETVDEALRNKNKLSKELENIDVPNLKVLETERKHLEDKIEKLGNDLVDGKYEFMGYLFGIAPILVTKHSLDKTLNIMSKLVEEGKLPPKIEGAFLDELLKKGVCICARDLNANERKPRKHLEALRKSMQYSSIAENAINLKFQIKSLIDELGVADNKIKDFETRIDGLEKDLDNTEKKLKNIKTKVGKIDYEKVKIIVKERDELESDINQKNGAIGKLKEILADKEDTKKKYEKRFNEELSKQEKYKKINDKINICDESIEYLEKLTEKLRNETRTLTEKYTQEYFKKLTTAKDFSPPIITPDYELVVEQDGLNAVTTLSAGETLCMGYSFMAALRKTSGFLAPIIIDTPLAKIDKEYRINVAQWIQNALPDAQIIMLMTNTEYTKEFGDAVKSCIGNIFLLHYDKNTKTSEVKKNGK